MRRNFAHTNLGHVNLLVLVLVDVAPASCDIPHQMTTFRRTANKGVGILMVVLKKNNL